jgi:ribosomal protein S17E
MSDDDYQEQTKRLPKELVDPYLKKLSDEFVENKKKNLSCCT